MEHTKQANVVTITISALLVIVVGILIFLFVRAHLPLLGYYAVFLDNDQVYFGKIAQKNSTYLHLTDVYYIQPISPLQNQQGANPNQAPNFQLIKLGNELHGPSDLMEINRDHVLFMERLSDTSKVVDGIIKYTASANK